MKKFIKSLVLIFVLLFSNNLLANDARICEIRSTMIYHILDYRKEVPNLTDALSKAKPRVMLGDKLWDEQLVEIKPVLELGWKDKKKAPETFSENYYKMCLRLNDGVRA